MVRVDQIITLKMHSLFSKEMFVSIDSNLQLTFFERCFDKSGERQINPIKKLLDLGNKTSIHRHLISSSSKLLWAKLRRKNVPVEGDQKSSLRATISGVYIVSILNILRRVQSKSCFYGESLQRTKERRHGEMSCRLAKGTRLFLREKFVWVKPSVF